MLLLTTAPLVAIHVTTVLMMTGIIVLVQCVHYPLFRHVPVERFAAFHAEHGQRITWVVGPLMGLELASASALAILHPCWLWACCAGLSALCFALTGWISVPLHGLLARRWTDVAHARLVQTNLLRTAAWGVHAALLVDWLMRKLPV